MLIKNIKIYTHAKLLAAKRRLIILLFGQFNPYPKIYKKFKLNPSHIVQNYNKKLKPKLLIENYNNHLDWKIKTRKKLIELLMIKNDLYCKEIYKKNIKIEMGLSRSRIYLEFAKNRHAPIDVIKIRNKKIFKGIIICMQGDNSGAHLSIGEKLMPADIYKVNNQSDIAIQAAKLGFIAISFERIGFGERREQNLYKPNSSETIDTGYHLLINGKTLLGETVNEICTLAKWLTAKYKNKNLWLKGYSSAGIAAITAAAVDDNKYIKGIAVGGCLGSIDDTLLKRGASGFSHIPHMREWFDMEALIGLVSPRPCLIVAGIKDHIFPYKLSKKIINKAKIIFKKDKVENNLVLIKGSKGHTYYPNLLWPKITKYF